ncbi:unnamed protein product [Blepharisma stoltei]|uniref:Myb-like DNA-binding domain containing protein n=1 Tax=Blepharisma stoltei TaxID=1481888 RepID=A0AAU9IKY7_9CILI|nr:unnamed protein product [Blepharisma stoltei]
MSWNSALERASDHWDMGLPNLDFSVPSDLEEFDCPNETISCSFQLNPLALSPEPIYNEVRDVELSTQCSQSRRGKTVWTPEEDELLSQLTKKYKKRWDIISNYFPDKNAQAVQRRWANKHDPNVIKTRWTPEEDELILKLYKNYGGNWKKITACLKGRPADAVKNRFYGTIKKKIQKQNEPVNEKASDVAAPDKPEPVTEKIWKEEQIIDSFLIEPSKAKAKPKEEALSLEKLAVAAKEMSALSEEEKRLKIKDLYEKMMTLQEHLKHTKDQIKSLEFKKI